MFTRLRYMLPFFLSHRVQNGSCFQRSLDQSVKPTSKLDIQLKFGVGGTLFLAQSRGDCTPCGNKSVRK
jgi:hypothetical protein